MATEPRNRADPPVPAEYTDLLAELDHLDREAADLRRDRMVRCIDAGYRLGRAVKIARDLLVQREALRAANEKLHSPEDT